MNNGDSTARLAALETVDTFLVDTIAVVPQE